jgi:hypothetical protein
VSRVIHLVAVMIAAEACRCGAPPIAPSLEVEPRTVDFGDVTPGSFTARDFTIRVGPDPVTILLAVDPSFGDPAGFAPVVMGPLLASPGRGNLSTWRFAPPPGAAPGVRRARVVLTAEEIGAEVFLVARVMPTGSTGGGASGGGAVGGGAAGGASGGGASGGGASGGGASGGGASGGGASGGGASAGGASAGGAVGGGAVGGGASGGGAVGGGASGGGASAGGASGGGASGGGAVGGGTSAGGASGGGAVGGGSSGGGAAGGGTSGGGAAGGSACGTPCTSWTQCTTAGTGCDTSRGCCVSCGGLNQPCCVDFVAGQFSCGPGRVCGRSTGSGGSVGYYCCTNAGDGCCQQGTCSGGTCCKCPRNGLNFCVQPSFGCGGC